MADKDRKIYKRALIVGLTFFIPFVAAAGPIVGYVLGSYLVGRLGWPGFVLWLSVLLGLAGGVIEVVKIIKLCVVLDKQPKEP